MTAPELIEKAGKEAILHLLKYNHCVFCDARDGGLHGDCCVLRLVYGLPKAEAIKLMKACDEDSSGDPH